MSKTFPKKFLHCPLEKSSCDLLCILESESVITIIKILAVITGILEVVFKTVSVG